MDRKLLYYAVAFLVLAWYFNDPVPRKFSQPWKLRSLSARIRLTNTLLWIPNMFFSISPVGLFRATEGVELVRLPDKLDMREETFDCVSVRIYRPNVVPPKTGFPVFIYYHGGGWVHQNNSRYFDQTLVNLATNLDMVAISVLYRLAPEHPFPVPFLDCVAATKHVIKNGKKLGVDSNRVIIGGDSAGGNLAAAVALKLRDDKFSPLPKRQLLIYPEVQAIDLSLPSYKQNTHGPYLHARTMATLWSLYTTGSAKYGQAFLANDHTTPEVKSRFHKTHIRHEDIGIDYHYRPYSKPKLDFGNPAIWNTLKEKLSSPYLSPLIADDVTGLPDAYVYTAQYDVVRDEGLLYVKKLRDAGVNVTHVHGARAFHGVCSVLPNSREGTECYQSILHYLTSNL